MAIDMTQFYQVFFEESAEHLANMEALLLELDVSNPDAEQLNAIFRAAHSIKGSAGTFGFADLADTTHILENLLDKIRKQELILREEMVDAFLEAGDLLRNMLEAHQGQGSVDETLVVDICNKLRQLSSNLDGNESQIEAGRSDSASGASSDVQLPVNSNNIFDIQFVPNAASLANGAVEHLLAELNSMGKVDVISRPEKENQEIGGGFWHIKFHTTVAPESFTEQVDFIADSGAWRISNDQNSLPIDNSFGLFEQAEFETDDSYGLFETMPSAVQQSESSPAQADEGYGFFDDLPAIGITLGDGAPSKDLLSEEQEENVGYGFFNDIGEAENCPIQSGVGSNLEDDSRGFGFFVPLERTSDDNEIKNPMPDASSSELPASDSGKEFVPEITKLANSGEPRASRSVLSGVAASGDSSIRVSVEKVDQLINLVGELVITQAMLLQTASLMSQEAPEGLANGLAQLERNTRDLQESVMSIRMMPISFVFSRFPRVVRDLSGKLGKQVELKTSGETTELDKGLIERIADPLTHLIRNSLDHGIESPANRISAGKNPVGTITLKAYHQGGNIVIEVGDDGAGLHRNKILSKAREKGMQASDQMTDSEVFNLIFEAGFSTADQITDVSGRGVGMDVVRRNIQSMGGRVEIDSMLGVGTRITVRLPLTLAILDGMSVAVGDQTYILPLSYVVESLQPELGDIKTLSNQARVIQVRGEYLPVVVLHEIFGLKSKWKMLTQGIMVVLEADGTKAALFVDALVGQHQVVIKSLEANYRRVAGVSGATIMGDGHVALILDVSAVAEMAKSSIQIAA